MVGGEFYLFCFCFICAWSYFCQYHSKQYPTLARIAQDYLAIQGSSVASERSFSSSGQTDTLNCNCIDPELFGYTQILKNLYNTKFLTAAAEAKVHEPMEIF